MSGNSDFDIELKFGDRPMTLRYTTGVALSLCDGIGILGRLDQIERQDIRAIAQMVHLITGGKFDDHGPSEKPLTVEQVAENLINIGLFTVVISLRAFLFPIQSGGKSLKQAVRESEESNKDEPAEDETDPQPKA